MTRHGESNRSVSTVLVLSQVYVPDPASVGQHMADAAEEMARRGHHVRVLTSGRGYDDPTVRYPAREMLRGVEVIRLPWSSFGKRSILLRLLGAALFLSQALVRGLFTPRLACVLVSTSPPMCSAAAVVISWLRRVPIKYWLMDLNPDQMIELGRVSPRGPAVVAFNLLNRLILGRSSNVIVLDRFMAQRVARKVDIHDKLTILPPWPHNDHLNSVAPENNPFVARHNLGGKFVVMYSGNHSLASPLGTLLEAALALEDQPRLRFLFIGGGLGKREVEDVISRHRPTNIISLPYQPLDEIKYSLSAADIHVVTLGERMVGIIHPCKVYGAMSVARPLLLLGPRECHVADLINEHEIGWQFAHGDVDGLTRRLKELVNAKPAQLAAMGRRAQSVVAKQLSKSRLCGEFCDILEAGWLEAGWPRRARARLPATDRAPTSQALAPSGAGDLGI